MVIRPKLIIAIVACAFFMENLDSTIVVTAIPQISLSFNSNPLHLSLAVTCYVVSFAVFILVGGWLSDRLGSGVVFRAAIVLFSLSSVCCGLSNSVTELVIARIFQGMGSAMMVPVGRAVVVRAFKKSEMVQAMAMISLPALLGPLLGAPVGGFITTYFSWRWNFFINVPVGILGFVLASLFIPNYREGEARRFDWLGFFLTGVTLGQIIYALELLEQGSGSYAEAALFLAGGVVVGLIAVWHARRTEAPLLDLSLLRVKTFRISTTGALGSRMATGATPYLLPLLFQVGFGRSPLQSGLLTFATALGVVAMRPWAKPILRRFGFRALLVRNGVFVGLTIMVYAFFKPSTPDIVIILVLMTGGFFRAIGYSSVNTLAYADIEPKKASAATAFSMMFNQLGNAFGVATGAVLLHLSLTWRGATQLGLDDFRFAFLAVGIVCVGSIPIFATLPRDAGSELSGHRPTGSAQAEGEAAE